MVVAAWLPKWNIAPVLLVGSEKVTLSNGPSSWLAMVSSELAQLGYDKLVMFILGQLTLPRILSSPVGPNCQGALALRALIHAS